jgi:hypothetical protein
MIGEQKVSAHKRRTRAEVLLVVESCRRLKISVRDYLAAILPSLADLPIKRLPSLTPTKLHISGVAKPRIVDFFSPFISRAIGGMALAWPA